MASITNLKENKTLFIVTNSINEIFVINYDHAIKIANLAIYENSVSFQRRMSLWQRLKYCFRILLYKKLYAEQILIDNKQLLELKTFLCGLELNSKIGV